MIDYELNFEEFVQADVGNVRYTACFSSFVRFSMEKMLG